MVLRANRLTNYNREHQATNEKLAPRDGFEPPAKRLTVACSTAELPGNKPNFFNRLGALVIMIKLKLNILC